MTSSQRVNCWTLYFLAVDSVGNCRARCTIVFAHPWWLLKLRFTKESANCHRFLLWGHWTNVVELDRTHSALSISTKNRIVWLILTAFCSLQALDLHVEPGDDDGAANVVGLLEPGETMKNLTGLCVQFYNACRMHHSDSLTIGKACHSQFLISPWCFQRHRGAYTVLTLVHQFCKDLLGDLGQVSNVKVPLHLLHHWSLSTGCRPILEWHFTSARCPLSKKTLHCVSWIEPANLAVFNLLSSCRSGNLWHLQNCFA